MMAKKKRIGIEAIWENAKYAKGQVEYLRKLLEARKKTEEAAKKMAEKTKEAAEKAKENLEETGAGAQVAGHSFLGMLQSSLLLGAGLGALLFVGKALYDVFKWVVDIVKEATRKLIEFGKESVQTAARVQELHLLANLMGQRMGQSSEQVDELVEGMRELGIRTDVANTLLIQFARYNLDMADATKLANVARNAATIAAQDTSDSLDNLLYGILTYNRRVLRTAGLNVNLTQSEDELAASLGKTRLELTERERIQASLNAVLKEGARIEGFYEAAMTTASKQVRSFRRYIFELRNAIGAPFLAGWSKVVEAVGEFIQGLTKATSAGGKFYAILIRMGVVFNLWMGVFKGVIDMLTRWITTSREADEAAENAVMAGEKASEGIKDAMIKPVEEAVDYWSDIAVNAFKWGANIIINFAEGMLKAIDAVLTVVLNMLGNLLSYFLAGHSPPRVAPDIIKWGFNTVQEWLKGFTQADFSVLKQIQAPLRDALGALVDIGEIEQADVGQIYADLSKDIIEGLKEGVFAEGFFDELREKAGMFGQELVQNIILQKEMADAVNRVRIAEEELERARKRESDTGAEVNKKIKEYNALLRAGAGKDVLRAKMAQINAAQKEHEIAKEQAKVAEESLETAQEQADIAKERAENQQALLDVLIDLVRAQAKPEERPERAGAGAGAEAGGEVPEPEIPTGGLGLPDFGETTSLVEELTNKVKLKFAEAWEEIKSTAETKLGELVKEVKMKLDLLLINLLVLRSKLLQAWSGFWGRVKTGAEITWGEVQTWLFVQWTNFQMEWDSFWGEVGTTAETTWEDIKREVTVRWNTLMFDIRAGLLDIGMKIATKWEEIKRDTKTNWEAIKLKISTKMQEIRDKVDEITGKVRDWFIDRVTEINEKIIQPIQDVYDTIVGKVQEIIDTLSSFSLFQWAADLVQGIIDGISAKLQPLRDAWAVVTGLFGKGTEEAYETEHSPSHRMYRFGIDLLKGMEKGINDYKIAPGNTVSEMIMKAVPTTAGAITNNNYYRSMTVNMGGQNIQSPITMAQFEAMFRRVIKSRI